MYLQHFIITTLKTAKEDIHEPVQRLRGWLRSTETHKGDLLLNYVYNHFTNQILFGSIRFFIYVINKRISYSCVEIGLHLYFIRCPISIDLNGVWVASRVVAGVRYNNGSYDCRSFKKAYNDVVLSRRAIRNMNTLYPDATPAELAAADNECIICREEMHTGMYSFYIYWK